MRSCLIPGTFVPDPMTLIDGYKFDHRRQYPPGTSLVSSNWTPRSSRVPGHKKVVYAGGQYFRQKILVEAFREFFGDSENAAAKRYERRTNGYLGPNTIGSDHIRQLHRLGYIPLLFRAVPEGTAVPLRVPMVTIENTHPDFAWMPNYFETIMSCEQWIPCTSATTALGFRRLLEAAAKKTGSPPEFVDWQAHDFSFRGLPGLEAAMLSGLGHLLYFTGTDTVPALDLIEDYYGVPDGYLIGGSVNATEHSVMCAGGEGNERETILRLLDLYPEGILSVVSDTWDLWHVLTKILPDPEVKAKIMNRNGKYVTRPDSGNPASILCGIPGSYRSDYNKTPAEKGVIELLWETFGGTVTSTGHRLLDSHVGAIYGDSITRERGQEITSRLDEQRFASANVVYGIGSYTYQYVTRDTYGFAMKATYVEINGKGKDIFKSPKTDDGVKHSARGRLAVLRGSDGEMHLVEQATPEQEAMSLLRPVWKDGKPLLHETFDMVRATARLALAEPA
jgi:nicotinamide phosphoribosyltransferase